LETLIPDFKGIDDQIQRIVDAAPEVFPIILKPLKHLPEK